MLASSRHTTAPARLGGAVLRRLAQHHLCASAVLRRHARSTGRVAAAACQPDADSTGNDSSCSSSDDEQQPHQHQQQPVVVRALVGAGPAVLGLALCALSGAPAARAAAAAELPTHQPVALQQVTAPAAAVAQPPQSSWQSRLTYRLLSLFSLPTYGKLLAVLAVAAPILALGSVLYKRAAEGDGGTSWGEAVLKPYSVLLNTPGSSVESERGAAADIVLHLVYLVGLLTFAAVLGVVCDDISTQVDKVRHGNHPVHEAGHTVVMNWNPQTLPVLQQMALAKAESGGLLFSGPVVVLADRDKEEMDEEVADAMEDSGLQVITRSGSPANPAEQHRAAAAAAATVVLLWPSHMGPAAAAAHTAAALASLRASGGVRGQHVVVQNLGEAASEYDATRIAVQLAQASPGGAGVASLTSSGSERIHQMMAQVASQPGLEAVFADLMEYEGGGEQDAGDSSSSAAAQGAEFYCLDTPQHLQGQTFKHVRRCFPRATVVGWVGGAAAPAATAGSRLHLNPPDASVVPAGSQLVFVAGSVADVADVLQEPYDLGGKKLWRGGTTRAPRRHITALCFNHRSAASMCRSIAEFSARGTTLTLVCKDFDHAALKGVPLHGIKLRVVDGDPASKSVLASSAAGLAAADSVVLCGLGQRDDEDADVQVVASVLQLQSLAASHKRNEPLAIVAALHDASSGTEDVLWHATLSYHAELKAAAVSRAAAELQRLRAKARKPVSQQDLAEVAALASDGVPPPVSLHLLRPDELKAGMLTQTAVAPQLAQLFSELFTQRSGHELYLRDPSAAFGLRLGRPLAWKQAVEAVRARGETLVGLMRAAPAAADAAGLQLGRGSEVALGLPAERVVVLQPGDRLVAIALDH